MQLAIGAEDLQIEGAFIFSDAPDGLTVAHPHGHGPIGRSAAATPATSRRRVASRLAQRLLDLRRCPIAADIREIGTQDAAAPPHHVTARARLRGEYSLARD